jgi:hypothetical protein
VDNKDLVEALDPKCKHKREVIDIDGDEEEEDGDDT